MYALGIDFETTILEPVQPERMRIVEIGAVLWEPRAKRPDVMVSRTVWDKNDPDYVFHPLIEQLTGMDHASLLRFGTSPKPAISKLLKLIEQADVLVGHNCRGFDEIVLNYECDRHGLPRPTKSWIDTSVDLPFPKKIETRKLEFLGPVHGFLNPFSHRALFDVLTMLKVMACYDFDEVFQASKVPDILVRACVKPPWKGGGDGNDRAKARGYRFNNEHTAFCKRIKEDQLEREREECKTLGNFEIQIVKE